MNKMTTFYLPGSGDRLKLMEIITEDDSISSHDLEEIK